MATEPGDREDFFAEERARPGTRWWLAFAAAAVIAGAVAGFFYLRQAGREAPGAGRMPAAATSPDAAPAPAPAEATEGEAAAIAPPAPLVEERRLAPLPPLAKSDRLVRELAATMAGGALPPEWLETDGLIERFVAAVDNVAEGVSPRAHLPFIEIERGFPVAGREGGFAVDPAGYRRYDLAARAVASVQPEAAAREYRRLFPIFQEAYLELGGGDRSFDDTLRRAMDRLLSVPLRDDPPRLVKGEKTWLFADQALEALSPAEKHLLRMGPENTRLVQNALRGLRKALEHDSP